MSRVPLNALSDELTLYDEKPLYSAITPHRASVPESHQNDVSETFSLDSEPAFQPRKDKNHTGHLVSYTSHP